MWNVDNGSVVPPQFASVAFEFIFIPHDQGYSICLWRSVIYELKLQMWSYFPPLFISYFHTIYRSGFKMKSLGLLTSFYLNLRDLSSYEASRKWQHPIWTFFQPQINVLMLPIFCARVFSEPSSFNIYCGFTIQ